MMKWQLISKDRGWIEKNQDGESADDNGINNIKGQESETSRIILLREENQLDAIELFIALVICSTCFEYLYTHHQKLETILVLLPNALVAGGRWSGAGQQAMRPG